MAVGRPSLVESGVRRAPAKKHGAPWSLGALAALALVASSGCIAVKRMPEVTTRGRTSQRTWPGSSIRVLVWNTYKANVEGWREDFLRLAGAHDLLLLQEGYWDRQWTPVYESVPGVGWWMGVTFEFLLEQPHPVTGTVLGSRVTPSAPVLCFHSPYDEALIGTPKSHLEATFDIDGSAEPLLAVTVHATNLHPDPEAFEAHMQRVFRRVSLYEGPAVVAGDFNTWSEGRTTYLFGLAARLGFDSVYDRGPATDEHDDGRLSWFGNYLDHAFVRGLQVAPGARVLRQVPSSDHKPLSFVVRLP